MESAEKIIAILDLIPHPEGGFYKETYKSKGHIPSSGLPEYYEGSRFYSTCIYFLMTATSFSAFHRIQQDEIWHFYRGAPIDLHILSPEGDYEKTRVGGDILSGELPQVVVPGGHWFAAEVMEENSFSLVGCTVAPGFSFEDFELGTQKLLTEKFPAHFDLITRLTRS